MQQVMVTSFGVFDEDAAKVKAIDEEWEEESWVDTGLCSQCGAELARTIGPKEAPVIDMQPTSPWQLKDA